MSSDIVKYSLENKITHPPRGLGRSTLDVLDSVLFMISSMVVGDPCLVQASVWWTLTHILHLHPSNQATAPSNINADIKRLKSPLDSSFIITGDSDVQQSLGTRYYSVNEPKV